MYKQRNFVLRSLMMSGLCFAVSGILTTFSLRGFSVSAQNTDIGEPTSTLTAAAPTETRIPLSPTIPAAQEIYVSSLTNYGAAPEIASLAWLNSNIPLRLANLRGSVVLLEFWTFDCINCIRTLPYIEQWYQTYHDHGLVVVGIHYPEFNYERDLQNVSAAAQRLDVNYPIGLDNDGLTWQAYGQRYWPTVYLIDKHGDIRYLRIGEGAYDETEVAINELLAETYVREGESIPTSVEPIRSLTPTDVLNVRSGPGIEQTLIGSINPGMSFVILGETNGWHQIRYNDSIGYVSGEYVTVTP